MNYTFLSFVNQFAWVTVLFISFGRQWVKGKAPYMFLFNLLPIYGAPLTL